MFDVSRWLSGRPDLGPFRFGTGATCDLTPAERAELDDHRHRFGLDRLDRAPTRILELIRRDGPPPPVPWADMSTAQLDALAEGSTFAEVFG